MWSIDWSYFECVQIFLVVCSTGGQWMLVRLTEIQSLDGRYLLMITLYAVIVVLMNQLIRCTIPFKEDLRVSLSSRRFTWQQLQCLGRWLTLWSLELVQQTVSLISATITSNIDVTWQMKRISSCFCCGLDTSRLLLYETCISCLYVFVVQCIWIRRSQTRQHFRKRLPSFCRNGFKPAGFGHCEFHREDFEWIPTV